MEQQAGYYSTQAEAAGPCGLIAAALVSVLWYSVHSLAQWLLTPVSKVLEVSLWLDNFVQVRNEVRLT